MSDLSLPTVSPLIRRFLTRHDRRKAAFPPPAQMPAGSGSPLESLESRTMMANVAATLINGNLSLVDNGSVSLTVSQPAANQIKLTPAAGSTINGQANAVTVNGVTGNFTANLGAGNDTLTFDTSGHNIDVKALTIFGTTGNKTVQTNTAGHDNFLNVKDDYTQGFTGDGNEFTRLNQFHVGGQMEVDHANGGSFVFLGVDPTNLGTQFNSVGGGITVNNVLANGQPGTGFDVNALEETNVRQGISVDMGNATGVGGWTTVGSLSSKSVAISGDVTIDASSGLLAFGDVANDGMEVQNAIVDGEVTMNLGSGAHSSALFGGGTSQSSTTARSVHITGQGAHDTVTVGASHVLGDLGVSLTGQGANSISVDDVLVDDDTSLFAGGGGNSIAIDDQSPGSKFVDRTDIAMTGRNNLLSINSKHRVPSTGTTTFVGRVRANLGAGDDTLILAAIGKVQFESSATFNGGRGHNFALVDDASVTGIDPTLVNFR